MQAVIFCPLPNHLKIPAETVGLHGGKSMHHRTYCYVARAMLREVPNRCNEILAVVLELFDK
jgi:hypothetical protein